MHKGGMPAAARAAAERISANAFFNALLREWPVGAVMQAPAALPTHAAIRLCLPGRGGCAWLPLQYPSLCGRHLFALPLWREEDGVLAPAPFLDLAADIASEPALFPGTPAEARALFLRRLHASVEHLEAALAARWAELPALFETPLQFAAAEQALLSGHSLHPTPRSRDQLAPADAERYAPEQARAFALQWLAVARDALVGDSATREGPLACARQVFADELAATGGGGLDLPAEFEPLPMHPWQWQRLRQHPDVVPLLRAGRIRVLPPLQVLWRATSSLRSVHAAHARFMLKFSLSLRLTNSLRTLLPKEMQRGLEVHRVKHSAAGAAFAAQCPQFEVLSEPAFLALRDAGGAPLTESLVLFRENPFHGAAAADACVLATLTQDDPQGGEARVARLIRQAASGEGLDPAQAAQRWFTRFLDVVVEPLVIAQSEYGLLFGAHQQNLVLRFDGPWPVSACFRDCQGTGYSLLARMRLADVLPELGTRGENLLDGALGSRLFAYYLLVNSCFGLIGAIGASGLSSEAVLLRLLRRRLQALRDRGPPDPSFLDEALGAPLLYAKGNFRCALANLNDTTAPDPFALYHPLPNPLAAL